MGKVILFAQQKGGAGKTMLLTQLAVHRAASGARMALIDLDPQRTTAAWVAERGKRGGAGRIELVESADWRARTDIRDAAREADLVFVDAPGSADVLGRGAMRAADFALIPCQPAMADVWASTATLGMARREGLAHAVVLNRVPPRGRAAEEAVAALMADGAPVLEPRIGSRAAFAEAFARGAGVTETARTSKAAAEIAALSEALDAALGR
ncbi:MAG TPA: ParA family protein [Thermohalobaculum sp.]|nr:ParA family protein [Thermohalobaculum sp.]